ncbi:winged helix-turn-helix transcriptional regulator [Arthrobacter castelli]|uniref:winged helix-turn-helix transcriptional regulator n=1 Tax=Arthrobacter castelli TaxID=271431 RepID=UPI00047B6C74|nr:helix-turn-helix domain-containing protein [Arthrobacter castelli]
MITSPRSGCPVNRALEVVGDQWSLVILRDVMAYDRRSFRELLTANDEGISAPVLSRRLADLTSAGFLSKTEAPRGKQGRYSLTELGIRTIPLMAELANLGVAIDPSTAAQKPEFMRSGNNDELDSRTDDLRKQHINADA